MKIILRGIVVAAVSGLATACDTAPLTPSADQVRFTRNPADVALCKPVGNVKVECSIKSQTLEPLLRNHTMGLGGNTVLVTVESSGVACEGVSYRCP